MFESDKLANNLNPTAFQCCSETILAGEGQDLPTQSLLYETRTEIFKEAVGRIKNYLSKAAALLNNIVRSDVDSEVRK